MLTTTGPDPVLAVNATISSSPSTPTTFSGTPLMETETFDVSAVKLLPLSNSSVPKGPEAGLKADTVIGSEALWLNPPEDFLQPAPKTTIYFIINRFYQPVFCTSCLSLLISLEGIGNQ